jgi:hypothetical protein
VSSYCMETDSLESQDIKKALEDCSYYPFSDSGPLIPFLDNEDVLYDFYLKTNSRPRIKQLCKKTQWVGKPKLPRVINDDVLKQLIRSLFNSYDGRKQLSKNQNPLNLYQTIWHWLRNSHADLFKRISNICYTNADSYFIDIKKLNEQLSDGIYSDSADKIPFTLILTAFAMLQKKDRFDLGVVIASINPEFTSLLSMIGQDTNCNEVELNSKTSSNLKQAEKSISTNDMKYLTVNSLDDLIEYEQDLEKNLSTLTDLFLTFTKEKETLSALISVSDLVDDGNVFVILNSLELNRQKISGKCDVVKNYLDIGCKQHDCQQCVDLEIFKKTEIKSDDSIENIILRGNQQKDRLKNLISKVEGTIVELEELKLQELNLISKGNLTIDCFQLKFSDSRPCNLIDKTKSFRTHISNLSVQVDGILESNRKELYSGIKDTITQQSFTSSKKGIKDLNTIKDKVTKAITLNELENIKFELNEFLIKSTDQSRKIRELSNTLKNSNSENFEGLLRLCSLLSTQDKSSIAFIILFAYKNECVDSSVNSESAIEVLIDTVLNSQNDDLPLATAFEQLFLEPNMFNYLNSNITNKELLERLVILTIVAALLGESESAAINLLQIKAVEISRLSLPKYFEELILAIVSQKTIKISAEDAFINIPSIVAIIEEQIAFENGKYRHMQRDSKHFSRFEAICVYPALEKLWKSISNDVTNSDLKKARMKLDTIDSSTWYQQLVDEYDKPLVEHRYFLPATLKVMEAFLENIKKYLSFSEIQQDGESLILNNSKFTNSLEQWAGGEKSRIVLISKAIELINVKTEKRRIKPFWQAIIQCPQIILNCPSFVLWLRKQRTPAISKESMLLILNDLSNKIDDSEIKELYSSRSSWESISILLKKTDIKSSKSFLSKFENDKTTILDKSKSFLSLKNNKLAISLSECIKGGRLPAAFKVIEQHYEEVEKNIANDKEVLTSFVNEMLASLHDIKEEADRSNMTEDWLDSIYGLSSKIERNLRMFLRNHDSNRVTKIEQGRMKDAIGALSLVVGSLSQSFEEVEHHLSPPKETDSHLENDKEVALQKCPTLINLWQDLSSNELVNYIEVKRIWGLFIKEFAKISNLYHDQQDDKKRFGIVNSSSFNYTYPIYQTAFYKPQSQFLKRPVRLYLYRNKVTLPELKRLEDELSNENSVSLLHIIFVPQEYLKLERFFKYDKGFKNFLLINEEFLNKIVAVDNHEVPVRQALHASVMDLANSSPFVSQGYCHQTNNIYVGRKDILQKLLNNPQAMIWGGRRIGKTSVLHALENSLNSRHYKVAYVYVDLQDEGDPDLAIAQKIASTLDLGTVKSIAVFEKKVSSLRRKGTKVAFLIDEVDEYIKKSRKAHGSAFPLATVLRQLVMDDSDKDTFLVYSGYHQLYYEAKLDQEKRRVGHPFINITQQIPIKDLTYDDIAELVKTGFEDMLGIKVHPSVPRLIAKKASRHPAFVQQFCRCLLEHVSKRRTPGTVVTITTKDVEAVYGANVSVEGGEQAFISYFNETLGYNLSHLGHAILLAVTDPEFNERNTHDKYFYSKDILDLLNDWCSLLQIEPPLTEHFHQTIELLVMTNMLTQDSAIDGHGRYRATYPTHLEILKRLDKINMNAIEDSLKEYNEKERDKGILL